MIRTWKLLLITGWLALTAGCQHCRRPAPPPCPPPCPPGVVGGLPPGAVGGLPPGVVVPPPPAPVTTPPGITPLPPGAGVAPRVIPPGGGVIPPPDPLPGTGALPPPPGSTAALPPGPARVDFRWTPAPETKTAAKGSTSVLLFPPEVDPLLETPKVDAAKTAPRKSLPAGIPNFTAVRDKVDAGLRPSLDDGLDWLAANGYKTVLHVRSPADADEADRKQVEKRGLKYLSLEVTPRELTRETVDEFLRIVRDTAGHPLFVYDKDGTLAGGLWYLYFRLAEETPDDVARVRAGSLGLRETGEMWEAARKLAP